jgi:hypothetical protein
MAALPPRADIDSPIYGYTSSLPIGASRSSPVWPVTIGITDNTPCVAPRAGAGLASFAWTGRRTIA